MASSSFQLNDPVRISRSDSSSRPLEGVVAYLGSVGFASNDSNDPLVGVRLTGPSVGLGKHNGTIDKQYFVCPPNCGIFVRSSALVKRQLSKLEELKLKRELNKTTAASSRSTGTKTPPRATTASAARATGTSQRTPPRTTPPQTSTASKTATLPATTSVAPSVASSTATSSSARKEELRQRRAALQARKQQQEASTATSTSSSVPVPSSSDLRSEPPAAESASASPSASAVLEMEERLEQQHAKWLQAKQEELESLQNQLDDARSEIKQAQEKAEQLQRQQVESLKSSATADEQQQQVALELQRQLDEAREELVRAQSAKSETNATLTQAQLDLVTAATGRDEAQEEVATLKTQLEQAERQLEDTKHASDSTALLYKERAKLQVSLSSLQRKVEELEEQKQQSEGTMENLVLDKEQLEQEKEDLQDKFEEAMLEVETAQVQVEELKLELEDARESATAVGVVDDVAKEGDQDDEDVASALSLQNTRLREALIRLREQSSLEKLEWGRQLRAAEKDGQAGKALQSEVETLRSSVVDYQDQIHHLKDMVEQGAAFETMVEDLSDRVMAMEDDLAAQRTIIREMEEAAELSAEMEEVQANEVKALTRDLEGRDTILRNLEEVIKMQRRREEDFVRTVGNYRTTVATLKQEKQVLLELQQGGEGEKSDMIASSQNALARAAQLVSDAANMRRREAKAALERVELRTYRHLSLRLESLLPQSVAAAEVLAIKGELNACKVVGLVSEILCGVATSYSGAIRPALEQDGTMESEWEGALVLSDEARQKVEVMIYQADFSEAAIAISSDVLRFIAAGQWPDLMSKESSIELGSMLGHATESLDGTFAAALKTLKEEGILTPEQSNLGALRQTVQAALRSLQSDVEREGRPILQSSWNPPGWKLMRDTTSAKFACHAAAAAMSSVLYQSDDFVAPPALMSLYSCIEQLSSQSKAACHRLSNVEITNESLVSQLSSLAVKWKDAASRLTESAKRILLSGEDIAECQNAVDGAFQLFSQMMALLRSANLNPTDDETFHALSPESGNVWANVTAVARSVRAIDGDVEEVHYLDRAHDIEHELDEAVENVPKLAMSISRVETLEKSLASKSKEASMQSARLSELEKLLAKTNSSAAGRRQQALDLRSSEEFSKLQKENRVLTEAMDVMQRQVDEYEHEIRVLKDFKSPGKGQKRTPRRAVTSVVDIASPYSRGSEVASANTGALEATLFRPALQKALSDASKWKAASVESALAELPPLHTVTLSGGGSGSGFDDLMELTTAIADYRMEKASISVVDLTRKDKSPSAQLQESCMRKTAASERLRSIVRGCQGRAFY